MRRRDFLNKLTAIAAVGAILLAVPLRAKRRETDCEYIRALIAECPEGGTVTIPPGEYVIECPTTLKLKHGMTLQGSPNHQSILTLWRKPDDLLTLDGGTKEQPCLVTKFFIKEVLL